VICLSRPGFLDSGLRKTLLYRLGPIDSRHGADRGGRYFKNIAAHHRFRGVAIHLGLALDTIALDRLPAARAHFLIVRSLVHHHGVVVSNVRHVGRFDHDRDVALHRHHGSLDTPRAKFVAWNKGVMVGADVVIIVGPIPNAVSAIEARFRRQRSPADVIFAGPPRNPSRRPFFARHPNPTDPPEPDPSAVMIRGPAKRLVGHPGPTGVRVNPTTLGVRSPTARLFCFARLPDVTVRRSLTPGAVRCELAIKGPIRSRRTPFRSFGRIAISLHGLGLDRCRLRHGRSGNGCGSLLVRQRFFAGVEVGLLLREALLFLGQMFRCQALLDLPIDFRFFLFLRRRFLAGNKNRESGDDCAKLFHCRVRPGWLFVIRMKLRRGPHTRPRN
jgi:hypothetical protein